MKHQIMKSFNFVVVILLGIILQSCSATDVGGNGDTTKPVVTLTGISDANDADNEIIGEATIRWVSDEPNPSKVDIYLSVDSGETYLSTLLAEGVDDTGEYTFDTNTNPGTVDDCRYCRIKIIARDVVGNESDPVESNEDFVINNVPQVLGVALFVDPNSNGADAGDTIVVPFDKDIEVRTGIASDIFLLPVLGDNIGPYATLGKGAHANELVIAMNNLGSFNGHLHVNNEFDPTRLGRSAPSGLNVYDNLPNGVLYARDSGRTASFVSGGIDIIAGFSDTGLIINSYDPVYGYPENAPFVTGDLDNDGDLDLIEGSYGGLAVNANTGYRVRLNNGTATAPYDLDTVDNEFCFADIAGYCHYTQKMALADVNDDGYLDLIYGSTGGYDADVGTRVWLNNQDGTFSDSGQALCVQDAYYNYCYNTYALSFGDVDDDGDQDFFEGNSGSGTRVWLNNGNGMAFVDSGQSLSSCNYNDPNTPGCEYYNTAYSITTGDVDGQNGTDVVVSYSGVANELWLNNGSGVFTVSTQLLSLCNNSSQPCNSYTYTTAVKLADANGDGDLDLFVAGSTSSGSNAKANRLWTNDGAGTFTDSDQSLAIYRVNDIVLADVDADDDLDLIQGADDGTHVGRNNGDGIYSDSGQVLGGYANTVSAGDVDGDTDLDLIQVSTGARLLLNSQSVAAHYFIDSEQTIPDSDTSVVAMGDVDGDGDLDKVEGSSGQGSRVFLNNISDVALNRGIYTDSGQLLCSETYGYCSYTRTLVLGDVDGDGDLDMVEGSDSAGNRVWLNNGSGTFTDSGQRLSACSYDDPNTPGCEQYYSSYSITLGNVDGDSDLDLVAAEYGVGTQVWKNNGTGNFSSFGSAFGNTSPYSIVLGNLDADTDLDLVVSANYSSSQVWENDGQGNFSALGATFGDYAYVSALGNVDGDADLDLIVTTQGYGAQVWKNDGSGNFVSSGGAFGNVYSNSIAFGDVDGDADLDVVLGSTDSVDANKLWLNSGTGSFGNLGQTLCARFNQTNQCVSYTRTVVFGDVDDDDDLDLIQGGNQANKVWLNDF